MHQFIKLVLCHAAIITQNAAYATKLSHKEYERFSGVALRADSNERLHVRGEGGNPYLSVLTDSAVLKTLPLTPLLVTWCEVS